MSSSIALAPEAGAVVGDFPTPGVYVNELDAFSQGIIAGPALQVLVGEASLPTDQALTVTSIKDFRSLATASDVMTQAVTDYFTNGGTMLAIVAAESADAADLIDAIDSIGAQGALDLAVPELRSLGDGDWQDVAGALVSRAVEIQAMAWIDPPADAVGHEATPTFADPGGVAALAAGLRTSVGGGAAQAVLLNGGVVDSAGVAWAASPGVLGMRAATDSSEGIWMSLDPYPGLVGVTPEDPLPDAGLAVLRFNGVTPILRIADEYTAPEIPVTLSSIDSVHYASEERMLLWLSQNIQVGMRSYVFAANNGLTWGAVTAMISSFLTTLFSEGAFDGETTAQSFTVQCGATPMQILNGYMGCTVRVDLAMGAWRTLTFQQVMAG